MLEVLGFLVVSPPHSECFEASSSKMSEMYGYTALAETTIMLAGARGVADAAARLLPMLSFPPREAGRTDEPFVSEDPF